MQRQESHDYIKACFYSKALVVVFIPIHYRAQQFVKSHVIWHILVSANNNNAAFSSKTVPLIRPDSGNSVRLKTGMDRNGPNNRNGPGITGTGLSFTYFFSSPIFISRLFSSYLYAYRRSMHMLAKKG